jgi:hypothetical protein
VAPKSERTPPPARAGRRTAQLIYLLFAAAFVVSSTWQVKRQVFGVPASSTETSANCSYLLGSFDEAITRALSHASLEHSRGKAEEAFEDVITAPLAAVEKHCTSPADREVFVAASRLKEAAEATVGAQQTAVAPLRAALQARRNP